MRRLDAAVFLSGAVLMGLEIVGSRVLAPVFGTSIFVWGALITTFLASLAVGYAAGGRLADRRPDPALLAALLASSACLLWLLFLSPAPLLALFARAPMPDRFRSLLAALVLFAPPSVLMGAVTPFAVRLRARSLTSIGSEAGRLSAVSTAGSILGTFAMAFVLIPAYPTRPIIFGLGLTLMVSAALVPGTLSARRLALGGALGCAAAAVYVVTPEASGVPVAAGKLVYEKETAYHHLRVVDVGRRRGLWFDARLQNFIELDPKAPERGNVIDGLEVALGIGGARPRSVTMIGLGAGVLPRRLTEAAPEIATTSIEIDPEVVRTAERFFRFAPDANDRVIVGDGRRELARQVETTDVIVLDAFYSDSVPFHLLTKEFDELCASKLSARGVYAANFAGALSGERNALFWAAVKTLRQAFPSVYILSPELAAGQPTFSGATVLLATRSPDRLDPGTIRDRGAEVGEWLRRPAAAYWATQVYDQDLKLADVPLLTDAYSPTDALQYFRRN